MHTSYTKNMVDFGWILPTSKQRLPKTDADAHASAHIRRVLALINGRFHSAWIADHLMDDQNIYPEALVTLSYYAGLFPDLYWGTAVLSQSYRNPALLAKMAATLQQLSNGKFICGLGAGWKADEYHAYGYDFPSAAVRIAQMVEAIEICKAMWDPEQAAATVNGRYYQINNAICQPKPDPPPPVMIGGGGEKLTLHAVAQHADWWNLPGVSAAEYARKLAILEGYCAEHGRSSLAIRKTWAGVISIAPTRSQAEKQMANTPIWPGDVPLVGTSAEIQAQIQAYVNLGVDLFIFSFADEPDLSGLTLFMHDVQQKFQ